jgi:long-chain fatty acid transport protein
VKFRLPLAAAVVVSFAQPAFGAGLFLTDRGVRPLGRGGAFVAGADDLNSISYNPAGLSEAGSQLLIDAAYIQSTTTFLRRDYFPTTSTGMPQTITSPNLVTGYAPFLPIPSIVGSHNFGLKTWNFGFGVYVPYSALMEYPERVVDPTTNVETPAPQRYSSISSAGTVLGVFNLFASKTFFEEKLAIGLGLKALVGQYSSTKTLRSCPGVICAEQDPDYDSLTQVRAALIFAPSLSLGARYTLTPKWRVGLALDLPYWIDSPARITTRLPDAAIFANATVDGTEGRMKLRLPLILRGGVEFRPIAGLRVELAAVFEGWSIHDKIDILRAGRGVNLNGVTTLPASYPIGDFAITRKFRDTFSVRLGAEYSGGTRRLGYRLRAGFSYERSAVPSEYLNALTVDLDKLTPSIGASLVMGPLSLDLVYAHVFGINTTVDPRSARIYADSPVRGDPVSSVAINGGDYTLQSNVIGIGMTYRFAN